MITFEAAADLHQQMRTHLRGRVEQVGFFLADFDAAEQRFTLHTWRPMPAEAFEFQSSYHVTLNDEVRPEIIKWAWDAGACLVEAHSHGDCGVACFSPSDIWGFDEWVPHVRWRLSGLPYAAIVTAGDTFDALAWVADSRPSRAEQVEALDVDGRRYDPTRLTLDRPAGRRARTHGI